MINTYPHFTDEDTETQRGLVTFPWSLYGTRWIASLCKHTLNAHIYHYLENVEILSSVYIPFKQNVQQNVLFSVQGRDPGGGRPRVSPL